MTIAMIQPAAKLFNAVQVALNSVSRKPRMPPSAPPESCYIGGYPPGFRPSPQKTIKLGP